jgi:Holliday junction resolvase RusA-like endonuclease
MSILKIEIPLLARSKKNSQNIIINPRTKKPMIIQSKIYLNFERECGYFLSKYQSNINYPINLKCTFIVPDKRKRDLTNLENAIADILVKYKVIEDDNYNIIASWDGSRILYQKNIEKTIIEINKFDK